MLPVALKTTNKASVLQFFLHSFALLSQVTKCINNYACKVAAESFHVKFDMTLKMNQLCAIWKTSTSCCHKPKRMLMTIVCTKTKNEEV